MGADAETEIRVFKDDVAFLLSGIGQVGLDESLVLQRLADAIQHFFAAGRAGIGLQRVMAFFGEFVQRIGHRTLLIHISNLEYVSASI